VPGEVDVAPDHLPDAHYRAAASFTTALDDDGRFELRHVPVGMCRLSLERDSRPKVSTPWFEAG